MNERPIGSGPFRVAEHAIGKSIRLERNPDYFSGGPKSRSRVDTVEMRFIPDPQTRVAEVVAGGLDVIMDVARDQAEQLRGVKTLQIASRESSNYFVVRMNTSPNTPAPQLKDPRVRQAIVHAIDREAMAKFLIGDDARVLHAACFPDDFGCVDTNVPPYAYDPNLARQLLAEAGYKSGFDIDLWAYRDRNEAEAIVGYLGAVGIRAHTRFVALAALTTARRGGRVGLAGTMWNSASTYDASRSVSTLFDFSVDDMNRDPEIRELVAHADSATNPDARKDAYGKALQVIAERAYALPLYSLPTYYVAAKELVFRPDPNGVVRFYEMSWK
jgi:peptide/nickel transport system substrate-binding protein